MQHLLLALCLLAAPAADDLTQESERQLLERILKSTNGTSKAVFEELGSRKSRDSLNALTKGFKELTGAPALRNACQAFRHYKDVEGLERSAINTLYSATQDPKPNIQRCAAHGLSYFPEAASAELRRIVDRSDDEVARANALRGLLPDLTTRAGKTEFRVVMKSIRTTQSLTRARCVKAFKAFLENGGEKLFKGTLSDPEVKLGVRRMILEALAASEGSGVRKHLLDGLKAEELTLVHEILLSLAQRGCDDYGKSLNKLIRSRDDGIRREALVAQARILGGDPTFFDQLLDQAADDDRVLRSAAAISLGTIKTTESLEALYKLLNDSDYSVRFQAMEAAFAARHPSAIPVLLERLQRERGVMRPVLLKRLSLLTGEDFGNSTTMWENWWRDHEEGFSIPPLAQAEQAAAERGARKENNSTRASFYGLRIVSDRICFVIDNSGSMKTKTASGKTRLAAMQEQLSATLRSLPNATLINLVFFAVKAEKWKDSLQVLNAESRADAIDEVMGLGMKSATVTYEGLMAGLEDPRVDTIYLLTDGQPYGGAMPNADDILRAIRRHNSVRHVVIHCISVGRDSGFLENLATENHGQYTRVD